MQAALEVAPATASAPKRVRRRRRRKHEGPPTFQFVTATDPEQFKDRMTMKGVRSQAMIQYRYKLDKSKETGAQQSLRRTFLPNDLSSATFHAQGPTVVPSDTTASQPPLRVNSANFVNSQPEDLPSECSSEESFRSLLKDPYLRTLSGYRKALIAVQLDYARLQPVTDHEATDERELTFALKVVDKVQSTISRSPITFDGTDPFCALPQFASPGVSSVSLIRQSNRLFVASTTVDVWVPVVMTHPHALLSTCCLTSTYVDMMNGRRSDSETSTLIKNESIIWINHELSNPTTQAADMTIILILHLIAGEVRNCDENVFKIHRSGLERIITQRGGMHQLGWNGLVAQLTASVIYDTYIFTERQPTQIFQDYIPSRPNPLKTSTAIPESPLYCPRSEFFTLAASPLCTETIYTILSDMRDLTEAFLSRHNSSSTNSTITTLFDPLLFPSSKSTLIPNHHNTTLTTLQTRLPRLPSAHHPNHSHSKNFLYESIRLAALIYTTALTHRIPLSAASTFPDPALSASSAPDLAIALYNAISGTDMSACWGSFSGVFFAVNLIGAAAARTVGVVETFSRAQGVYGGLSVALDSTLGMTEVNEALTALVPPHNRPHREWARRCMAMYATRVRTVLVFGHPVATIAAQKRLLAVMEVLGRGWRE